MELRTSPTGAANVSLMVNSMIGTAAASAMPRARQRTKSSVCRSVSARPASGACSARAAMDASWRAWPDWDSPLKSGRSAS